jgi:hypothetical protein
MRKRAEEFMDQSLDQNVKPAHPGTPKDKVAKVLSKRCAKERSSMVL